MRGSSVRVVIQSWMIAGAALLSAHSARAQVFDSSSGDYAPPEPERRYGFAFGLGLGGGYGNSLGYPNKLGQIDNPEFEQNVSGFATSNVIWFGGTLRDWFTFGIGLSGRGAQEGDYVAQNGAFVLHLEGFPLYALGGGYRDLGLVVETGAGSALITDVEGEVVADGGAVSVIGVGAFYEPWQFWHFSAGPALMYTHEFSQPLNSHVVTLGMRLAFYGVQP